MSNRLWGNPVAAQLETDVTHANTSLLVSIVFAREQVVRTARTELARRFTNPDVFCELRESCVLNSLICSAHGERLARVWDLLKCVHDRLSTSEMHLFLRKVLRGGWALCDSSEPPRPLKDAVMEAYVSHPETDLENVVALMRDVASVRCQMFRYLTIYKSLSVRDLSGLLCYREVRVSAYEEMCQGHVRMAEKEIVYANIIRHLGEQDVSIDTQVLVLRWMLKERLLTREMLRALGKEAALNKAVSQVRLRTTP